MRLRRKMIDHVAKTVTDRLLDQGLLTVDGPRETVIAEVSRLITADLMIEDRLNDEVRELLKAYESQIEKGQVDYQKMFQMIKRKLAKERGIIL